MDNFKTVPTKFDTTGWVEATEDEAEMWANYHYTTSKGYGWGWFPAYEIYGPSRRTRYMYHSRQEAEDKMAAYILKEQGETT
jgi:hypothetical protein